MKRATVLTGGVGGAKVVLGLVAVRPRDEVVAVVNTGDDFTHFGLRISPDIDTLLYTLSGQSNETLGWGRRDETWNFMAAAKSLGGEDWFNLGDGDLALHVLRTWRLRRGERLSSITARFARSWGVSARILPMSDDVVRTMLMTDEGEMAFQNYFVEHKCRPKVSSLRFDGAHAADAAPGVVQAIAEADTVIIAPSNPFLSLDPILAVPSIFEALKDTPAPIVAVSPLVGGKAVKGPTSKIMAELGLQPDNTTIAKHYAPLLDGLIIDDRDAPPDTAIPFDSTDTLMKTLEDRKRVARTALTLAQSLQ